MVVFFFSQESENLDLKRARIEAMLSDGTGLVAG